jgi:hypothetical protein
MDAAMTDHTSYKTRISYLFIILCSVLFACHKKTIDSFGVLRAPYQPGTPTAPKFLSFTDAETPQNIAFSPSSIFMATDGGLVVVERETREAAVLDEQSGLLGHDLKAVLVDASGQTWVAGVGFVSRYEQKWESMPGPPAPVGLAVDVTNPQTILVAARSGLFRSMTGKMTPLSEHPVNAIQQTNAGVWLASDDGLFLFTDEKTTPIPAWSTAPLLSLAIDGELILAITRDKNGKSQRLLYGTKDKILGEYLLWDEAQVTGASGLLEGCALRVGRRLYRLVGTEERSVNFVLGDTKKGFFQVGISDREITAIALENNRVYAGLPSFGLTSFGGEVERYISGDLLPTSERAFLASDSKGAVYVPTRGPYLAKFIGDRFIRIPVEPSWEASIIAVNSRGDDVFLVVQSNPGGPLLFKKLKGDEVVELGKISLPSLPKSVRATFFEISPEAEGIGGDFWLGLEDEGGAPKGLLWVSKDIKTAEHLRRGMVGTSRDLQGITLPSDAVAQVRFVRGAIWLATNGGLIWRKGEKMRTFGENEGLDSELVRDVAIDRLDLVWLATGSGVGVLQQGGLWNFDRYRSVLGELRVKALLNDQEGTMWVGTDKGSYYWRSTEQNAAGEWGSFSRKNGLCGDLVADLAQDALGRVWHLTEGGFCVASPKN